jgi:Cof subfamily protein (haloacid dehalogenase superfamily)
MGAPIFITDLDGTLLQADASLTPLARETLTALHGEGVKVTVATARSLVSVQRLMEGVPLALPAICDNGGHLADAMRGTTLHVEALDANSAQAIFGHGEACGLEPMVYHFEGDREGLVCPLPRHEGHHWFAEQRRLFRDPRFCEEDNVRTALRHRVMTLTFIDREDVLSALADRLHTAMDGALTLDLFENRYTPGWWWLTAQSSQVSKGEGLRRLAEREGFDLADTIVFGDATNDISMFEVAGWAVAVDNALPEVKAAADEVIGPHTEDAVVLSRVSDWTRTEATTRRRPNSRVMGEVAPGPSTR